MRFFLLPVLAGLLTLSGCGTYRNATAYFNTYYNADRLFDEAVAEMLKSPQTARDSNYFAPYKVPQAVVTKFEKVIEKGSRVIQFHGESGYVEDAIMMIGKSYLHQNETESAAGKFRELLDNFPESDKRAEARLWLAKALYQGRNDEEALTAAKELAAPNAEGDEEEIPGDILLEITMLEAQIYSDRGEFAQAAATLGRIESIGGEGQLKAIAQYQLGTVYEKTGDYARAGDAYGLVREFSPTPAMSFNARLRQGVMLSMAGHPDEALETFDEIIAWPLKPEQSGLVDLEIANAYWVRGDSAAAFTLYDIIDSTYRKSDASARSYFKRGEIFEKQYRDLARARKYFEQAKGEFPASPVTQPAAARFTSLDRYLKTHDRLAKDDSTLQAILHPDTLGTRGDSLPSTAGIAPDSSDGGLKVNRTNPDDFAADTIRPERVDRPAPTMISSDNLSMRAIRNRPRHLVPDP
ncbi:MAG TPA: tetratricopeptide repeat protein, partial [Bacteroidota bacterium]|nr:tetratricopeptide repeat protein [Bacteroidota bacterium]